MANSSMLNYLSVNFTVNNGTIDVSTSLSPDKHIPSPLEHAMDEYGKMHGPLALVACIIGITLNIINIVVLSHKDMITPVNRLLQAIAVCDIITMATYIPYSVQFYIAYGSAYSPRRNSQVAAYYLMVHAISSIVSHTASIWLTVSVALFRVIFLCAKNSRVLCSLGRAYLTIVIVILISVGLNLPQCITLSIVKYTDSTTNQTWYNLDQDSAALTTTQYIIAAVFVKIGPSTMLIILSALLINIILKAQQKYQNMRGANNRNRTEKKRLEQTNQTTQLLVAVAIMFTLAELPQGILYALAVFGGHTYEQIFYPMGILIDLITIVGCTINFILYCSMSHQFRKIFAQQVKSLYIFKSCKSPIKSQSKGITLSTQVEAKPPIANGQPSQIDHHKFSDANALHKEQEEQLIPG